MGRLADLRVRLIFEEPLCKEEQGRVHVFLEDTTLADAAALPVAHQTCGWETRECRFERVEVEEKRRYTVRAWVDCDGDGKVSKRDWVSTESYPVLTQGYPGEVAVKLCRV